MSFMRLSVGVSVKSTNQVYLPSFFAFFPLISLVHVLEFHTNVIGLLWTARVGDTTNFGFDLTK